MLYTEDTRIEALAVHVVGNKSKDEPLTVSPELSAQVADEGLMRTLTAYFLGGFKSEECYNLHHETDLGCNEVWNFACRIFDDPEALLEHSVSLAKHLYESGMHPQIKGGEFYTVYFSDCNFGGERCDALGLFKSETRDTFLDVEQQAGGVHIAAREGIDIKRLDKGAVIFNTEREEGFAVFVVDNTNRTEARYWIDDFLRVRPAAGQLPQYAQHAGDVQEIRHETPLEGVRGVEGRPGRAAQRDDEVFPRSRRAFRWMIFRRR